MKRIGNMWRLTLRKILAASVVVVVSLIFGSCYWVWDEEEEEKAGTPPSSAPVGISISGTVKDGNGNPVPEFWVSILKENTSSQYAFTFTDKKGKFELSVPGNAGCCYTLFFQDVDGTKNGEFESQTVKWCMDNGPLNIILKPKKTDCEGTEPEGPGCMDTPHQL
jgi:putative lipoprotein (rSAM/lipoprotein system)